MDNKKLYLQLAEGEIALPSDMGVIPAEQNYVFTAESIKQSLKASEYFKLISFEKEIEESTPEVSSFITNINYREEAYTISLSVTTKESLDLQNFGFGNQVEESAIQAAQSQLYYLTTSMYFGDQCLDSFHLQLKLLDAIVPDASIVVDFMSFRLLSGEWLKIAASSSVPPSPDYLYTVHSVYSESEDKKETSYWLHTHGLHRCKSVELEILNIKQGAQQMFDMLNVTAKRFVEGDIPPENEEFTVGYDGLGINICWTRWENAITLIPKDALGGANERQDKEDIHNTPTGVLFAVQEGHMVSPEIYTSTLAENPLYYISNSETKRMSELAKEQFYRFKKVFESVNKNKPKSWNPFAKNKKEEWTFLVKLGLVVDDADSEDDKEHCWFNVIDIENTTIYAELINEPYWISGLKKGDKKKFPLDILTDWIIYSSDDTYTSDSIYRLKDY